MADATVWNSQLEVSTEQSQIPKYQLHNAFLALLHDDTNMK